MSGAVIKGQRRGERVIDGHLNRAKSNEKQLIITDAEPTMTQETLEEKYDYHHPAESLEA